jgi:hypothetical protein
MFKNRHLIAGVATLCNRRALPAIGDPGRSDISRRIWLPGLVIAAMLIGACSSGSAAPSSAVNLASIAASAAPTTAATPSPSAAAEVVCTSNANDACLGRLAAGTYSSALFNPSITFTVPAGWADHADSLGEYVLYAPGSKPNASEFGARDWIAFEANVTLAPEGCPAHPKFDASKSAADIASWMAKRAHLVTTSPKPVSVGGLSGLVLDVRLADDAPVECFPVPAVLLVHGIGASEGYDQAILAGTAMRFYLFDHGKDVLMIEIDDVSGGSNLDNFAAVLETVQFSL